MTYKCPVCESTKLLADVTGRSPLSPIKNRIMGNNVAHYVVCAECGCTYVIATGPRGQFTPPEGATLSKNILEAMEAEILKVVNEKAADVEIPMSDISDAIDALVKEKLAVVAEEIEELVKTARSKLYTTKNNAVEAITEAKDAAVAELEI